MAWFKFLLLTSFTIVEAASLGLYVRVKDSVFVIFKINLRSALLFINHFTNLEIETKLRFVTRRTTSALYTKYKLKKNKSATQE